MVSTKPFRVGDATRCRAAARSRSTLSNAAMFCPTSAKSSAKRQNAPSASASSGAPASMSSDIRFTARAPGSMRTPAGSATKVSNFSSSQPSITRTAPISTMRASGERPVVSKS